MQNKQNKSQSDAQLKVETKLVQGGRRAEWTGTSDQPGAVVSPPIWRASTHLYPDVAALEAGQKSNADGLFFYGRRGSPTQWALSEALTALEPGAAGTVLYPSGVAAISGALLAVVKPGDVLFITDNSYAPSRYFADGLLKRLGITTRYFDPLDLEAYRSAFCDKTSAVLLESPGSLTMEVCDVPALAAIAREQGAVSMIDNTWATPLGFPALKHGCDIAIMALTKHACGHSDVLMGSASAAEPWHGKLRRTAQDLGHIVSPDDAALVSRGLRTLSLRLRQQSESALQVASWLKQRAEVAHMLCPMLPGCPGYELWSRDFSGGCGLFSFVLKGQDEAARARFIDALQLFGIGYSWGGFESLVIPFDPAPIRSAGRWPPEGWDAGDRLGVRLYIGLENPDDLIADLSQGFEKIG